MQTITQMGIGKCIRGLTEQRGNRVRLIDQLDGTDGGNKDDEDIQFGRPDRPERSAGTHLSASERGADACNTARRAG